MKNKICVLYLMSCLFIGTLVGCGMNSTKTEELNMVDTIGEDWEKTNISDKGGSEEDLSGVVPLSKKINKGKMIAFGCMGGLHDAYVYKIFFFDCGKVTVVCNLEPIGEYGGFKLESLEELLNKSEEELWGLCDDFKKNSEEFVVALKANCENTFCRLTDPNAPDFDLSFSEVVKTQPDSGNIYNIILPVIDAPFVISIESDETNSIVSLEQILIAAQRVSKTYGGTMSIDGEIDGDFFLTNMAEGAEIEIGDIMCSIYPAYESNIAYLCLKSESGFYFDSLDTPDIYINNQEVAYDVARKLLVE